MHLPLKAASLMTIALLGMAAPAYAGGRDYNECRNDRGNSRLAGALIGGVLGAALGHEVAARNARDEGLLLGGAIGAAIGAGAGESRVYCGDDGRRVVYTTPPRPAYDDRGYDRGWHHDEYDDDDRYDDRYDAYAYNDRDRDRHHRHHRRGPECRMGESNIYLPDGRVDRRAVKMCRGHDGAWRVVD